MAEALYVIKNTTNVLESGASTTRLGLQQPTYPQSWLQRRQDASSVVAHYARCGRRHRAEGMDCLGRSLADLRLVPRLPNEIIEPADRAIGPRSAEPSLPGRDLHGHAEGPAVGSLPLNQARTQILAMNLLGFRCRGSASIGTNEDHVIVHCRILRLTGLPIGPSRGVIGKACCHLVELTIVFFANPVQ
jgi:hypothetical protein